MMKYKNQKVTKEQQNDIVAKALIPDNTLKEIGDYYGISNERVRQIVAKKTGYNGVREVRKNLIAESDKFRCPICGKKLSKTRIKKGARYCEDCYKLSTRYDLETEKTCEYCGGKFFPYRNWKQFDSGKYGSMGCYVNHMKEVGKWDKTANDDISEKTKERIKSEGGD